MRATAETLLVISISVIGGSFVLQLVWAVTADIIAGRRRTDFEIVAGRAALMDLALLVPEICRARSGRSRPRDVREARARPAIARIIAPRRWDRTARVGRDRVSLEALPCSP